MKFRCKPGDMAVVASPYCPLNAGRIVLVVRQASSGETVSGYRFRSDDGGPWWVCEGNVYAGDGTGPLGAWVFSDYSLRPIRDQPGDDESITWAGLPHKQGTEA